MLINLSNHPFSTWQSDQANQAIDKYGGVTDIDFPVINPRDSIQRIQTIAEEYHEKIISMAPEAVHLMGEMTFTYTLVNKLKSASIPCIASTTERVVSEIDGKKMVHFSFVTFRNYF